MASSPQSRSDLATDIIYNKDDIKNLLSIPESHFYWTTPFQPNVQMTWPVATARDFSECFSRKLSNFVLLHDGMLPYTVCIKFPTTLYISNKTKIAFLKFKD